MRRRGAALALLGLLVACRNGASYLDVTLTSGAPLTVSSIDVTLDNAGMIAHLRYLKGESFSIPPDDSFVVQLDPDRTGDASIDVSARGPHGELAHGRATVAIVPGGTASLTIPL